jgi:hypothetical protein
MKSFTEIKNHEYNIKTRNHIANLIKDNLTTPEQMTQVDNLYNERDVYIKQIYEADRIEIIYEHIWENLIKIKNFKEDALKELRFCVNWMKETSNM